MYSAFEHIAKALFVGRWRETAWCFMKAIHPMTAYFDESKIDASHSQPVVAGFCNTYEVWEVFERKWKEAAEDIPEKKLKKYLRHRPTDFHYPEDDRRLRDCRILAKVLRDYTLWPIHVSIDKSFIRPIFGQVLDRDHPLMQSAYSICAFVCCELLDGLAIKEKFAAAHTPIKVVFDAGNEHQCSLDNGYRAYYAQKTQTALRKIPIFEADDDLIPLKAADAYAWWLSRKYNDHEELEQLEIIHDLKHYMGKELVITKEKAQEYLTKINATS